MDRLPKLRNSKAKRRSSRFLMLLSNSIAKSGKERKKALLFTVLTSGQCSQALAGEKKKKNIKKNKDRIQKNRAGSFVEVPAA